MSYSFDARAADKSGAIAAVKAELAKVVASQPIHEADRDAAQAAAENMIGLLRDDPAMDVGIALSGSIWKPEAGIQSAGCSVSANLVPRA